MAGLLLVSMATLAQQKRPVEITSEPSHHLVFENQYVRVFDVTVAPMASTLVHRHNFDYVFVTLGDSEVASARPDEKPVELSLKDGETRFTAGNFSHAAINRSPRPFHNITIELLKPSTNVKTCTESCETGAPCGTGGAGCSIERRIAADQWQISLLTMSPSSRLERPPHAAQQLLVAVSDLDLTQETGALRNRLRRSPGGLAWIPAGTSNTIINNGSKPASFVTLAFPGEKQ